MLELQGDSKGLSVGGLAVINKSMSLTVSSLHFELPISFCNRPFQGCRKPLFENEGKCKTLLVQTIFFIIMKIKLIFTRKVLHLALF